MTVLQRVATIAAMTFVLAGIAGLSTPGEAAGLQAAQIAAPAATPATPFVPALDPQAPATSPAVPAVVPAPVESYDSLDRALAAQDAAAADEATRCLAGAIYFEAKGEPIDGQLAVAEVIINRARSGRFPPDVCAVVKQRGQFSFVRGGAIPPIDQDRGGYRTAIGIAKVAMAKAWASSAPNALYFHARRVSASARMVKVAAIGNHVFYR